MTSATSYPEPDGQVDHAPENETMTTSKWVQYPTLYEINTWVWLAELSRTAGKPVDLGCVSAGEWDRIAHYGFHAVWLMGVWERSPAGIAIANQNKTLVDEFRRVLPDFKSQDNVGSPYGIRRYVVDGHLGGAEGLAVARRELANRGMKLLLDFVPNHVAPDHPWGRDPFFPAWPDVLQLNAFAPGLRQAATDTVSGIAAQCDGIRCDMAMLLLNT